MGDEMYTSDEDDYYSENEEEAGGIFTQGYVAFSTYRKSSHELRSMIQILRVVIIVSAKYNTQ